MQDDVCSLIDMYGLEGWGPSKMFGAMKATATVKIPGVYYGGGRLERHPPDNRSSSGSGRPSGMK
jgi:hypothetical protein